MGWLLKSQARGIFSPSSKIVRKTPKGSRANSSIWFWLKREGQKPCLRGTQKGSGGGWPGCPGACEEWRLLWRTQGAGRADRSQGRSAKVSPLPDKFLCLLCWKERVRPGYFIWPLSARATKDQARESFCLKGCGSSWEEPLFLQRIFRSAAGFGAFSSEFSPHSFCAGPASWT